MKRRAFLALLGGATAAWPSKSRAQPGSLPIIGYLSSKGEVGEAVTVAGVKRGLNERGFIDGKNFAFLYRYSDGDYSRLPRFAMDLVQKGVFAIAASGLPAALAAKSATSTLPIVFRLAIDPVAFGLAQSFDRPGGNLTGVTMLFDLLTAKKLQLLHELNPGAKTIGLLVDPNNQNADAHKQRAERAAAALDLRLSLWAVGRAEDIEAAFAAGRDKGVGALLVGDDPLFDVLKHQLIDAAARYRIATMYYVRDFVVAGGLISYGPSFDEMATQEGAYLGRILEGAKPADLPIQQPTRIELVINAKAAKMLDLAIPSAMIATADEVIE